MVIPFFAVLGRSSCRRCTSSDIPPLLCGSPSSSHQTGEDEKVGEIHTEKKTFTISTQPSLHYHNTILPLIHDIH